MTDFTRRTHVVRISDAAPGQPPSGNYIDIEVLDAIAFKRENGKEAILNFAGGAINPYIVDNTGDGNGKTPDATVATRRSHMQRITSPDGTAYFDAEILDIVAFRDENGMEWIMEFPTDGGPLVEYNKTTGSGDTKATRRVHNEKISADLTNPKPTTYLTSVRTDAIAFRTIMGREMIVSMPSNDDPLSGDPRASTHLTPPGYKRNDSSVIPPANPDANVYAYLPKGGSFLTGDTPIDMGPLWWIRRVASGDAAYVLVNVSARSYTTSNSAPPYPAASYDLSDKNIILIGAKLTNYPVVLNPPRTTETIIYFPWNSNAPFPTLADWNTPVFLDTAYVAQFGQLKIQGVGSVLMADPYIGSIGYSYSASVIDNYIVEWETKQYGGTNTQPNFGYFLPDGEQEIGSDGKGPVNDLYTASLTLDTTAGGGNSATMDFTFLIKIPSDGTPVNFNVGVTGCYTASISLVGSSDTKEIKGAGSDLSGLGEFHGDGDPDSVFITQGQVPSISLSVNAYVRTNTKDDQENANAAGGQDLNKAHDVILTVSGGVPPPGPSV